MAQKIQAARTIVTNGGSSLDGRFHKINDWHGVLAFGRLVDVGNVGGVVLVVVDPVRQLFVYRGRMDEIVLGEFGCGQCL